MSVKTVEARVLLGWMERDQAVKYLMEECIFDPSLTESQAEQIWHPYRRAVESLTPTRECCSPVRHPLTGCEITDAKAFLKFFRGLPTGAPNILEVIKVDPRKLVVHQLYVVTDRADGYTNSVKTPEEWSKIGLPANLPGPKNLAVKGCQNGVEYHVPHMEFGVTFSQQLMLQNGGPPASGICIGVQEAPSYISVSEFQGRTLLWAGYHRSFARMLSTAEDAIARSHPAVVLTTDADFLVSTGTPNQGLRDIITGPTPPLFGDFFRYAFIHNFKTPEAEVCAPRHISIGAGRRHLAYC